MEQQTHTVCVYAQTDVHHRTIGRTENRAGRLRRIQQQRCRFDFGGIFRHLVTQRRMSVGSSLRRADSSSLSKISFSVGSENEDVANTVIPIMVPGTSF